MDFRQILMVAATQGGGVYTPTLGPELWPQPTFDASTGLTLTRCSVTGGQLVFSNTGAPATCIGAVSAGTLAQGDVIQYSFDIVGVAAAGDGVSAGLGVGGGVITTGVDGTKAGTVTLTGAVTSQTIRFTLALNDSGVVTIDNVSFKKLS
jgi:hypothetical protein